MNDHALSEISTGYSETNLLEGLAESGFNTRTIKQLRFISERQAAFRGALDAIDNSDRHRNIAQKYGKN